MVRKIELDIRPIPQLYGSSYHGSESSNPSHIPRPPGAPRLFGSCLSASFEMIVDWAKNGTRNRAYSSFKSAGSWSKYFSRKGHPNGDEFVNLMWNQATLHNTIYGNVDSLLHLVGSHDTDGGLGGFSSTVSLDNDRPNRPAINESVNTIQNRASYLEEIRNYLKDRIPLIARIQDAKFVLDENEFPTWSNERPSLDELPMSRIQSLETVNQGHAVVIAGIYETEIGAINFPQLNNCDLLIFDPAPSIELENYPTRFYDPPATLIDSCWHTHRVAGGDFIRYLKTQRGLISLHPY